MNPEIEARHAPCFHSGSMSLTTRLGLALAAVVLTACGAAAPQESADSAAGDVEGSPTTRSALGVERWQVQETSVVGFDRGGREAVVFNWQMKNITDDRVQAELEVHERDVVSTAAFMLDDQHDGTVKLTPLRKLVADGANPAAVLGLLRDDLVRSAEAADATQGIRPKTLTGGRVPLTTGDTHFEGECSGFMFENPIGNTVGVVNIGGQYYELCAMN